MRAVHMTPKEKDEFRNRKRLLKITTRMNYLAHWGVEVTGWKKLKNHTHRVTRRRGNPKFIVVPHVWK